MQAPSFRKVKHTVTINSQTISPVLYDENGKILMAYGTAAASTQNSQDDYAKGALYIDTDVSTGTAGVYQNIGTAASSSFELVTVASTGDITEVLAGNGLTGGGSSGSLTINAVAGPGIDVQADSIGIADSYLKVDQVTLTNAEMLALRATPKTLVNAPGAGRYVEFISATMFFDYTGAYTETDDNMQIKFTDGSGAAVSETIEATGFVDATADTIIGVQPATSAAVAKTASENQALVLHNTGSGEYGGGNAANAVRVNVVYRIHSTQF